MESQVKTSFVMGVWSVNDWSGTWTGLLCI